MVEQLSGGGSVAIARPTPGWVRLSLWISVGASHAQPGLATLAARWAAQQAGVEARVLPEATELALDCDLEQERLPRCVRRLASALTPPAPSAAEVATLMRRLRREHRRQASAQLDLEALSAMWGQAVVARWDPLFGGDARELRAESVAAFVRDHYGPNRALLVAAGEVQAQDLDDWAHGVGAARLAQPPATTLDKPADGHVRVVEGARNAIVLALSAPSVAEAAALGRAFQRPHPGSSAHAFSVGGKALLLLRVPVAGLPWDELRTAAFDAWRLSLEGTEGAPPRALPQDLTSLCRRTGEAWIRGREARGVAPPWPLAAAVSMPGLAPVAPSQEDHVAAAQSRALERAQAALGAARAQISPARRGQADAQMAEVTLENGVTIEVRRRPHDATFAASVEVVGGGTLDPPTLHGRAALLASLASSACGFASHPALDEALRAEGSRMRPLVSASRWGVLAYGPPEHWQRGVDRLLRCVARPSFRGRDLEDARVALLSRLSQTPGAEHAWAASRSLLPEAPGALAPWGHPNGVAAVDAGSLRTLHARSMRGPGVVVRLRVPAPANEAADFVARRLAQLPGDDAIDAATPKPAPPTALTGVVRGDHAAIHAWVGLAASHAFDGDATATALAEQVGYRLDALPGYALRGVAAGGRPFAWLWLELLVTDPEQLDALPAAVDAALRATRRDLPGAIEATRLQQERARRSNASDPARELRSLFVAPTGESPSTRALRELLEAQPALLVSHPSGR